MSIRTLVDTAVVASVPLMAVAGPERWFEAGGVGGETPPFPFAEYRWGVETPAFKMDGTGPVTMMLDVYFHDEPGNYSANILPMVREFKRTILSAVGTQLDGTDLIGVSWEYDGPDSYDDGHRSAVRYSRYRLAGTGF